MVGTMLSEVAMTPEVPKRKINNKTAAIRTAPGFSAGINRSSRMSCLSSGNFAPKPFIERFNAQRKPEFRPIAAARRNFAAAVAFALRTLSPGCYVRSRTVGIGVQITTLQEETNEK
jgi:hypothetical protein